MTSSPRVGVFRESMVSNPRIVQAPVGKTRSRGFSLPGPDFTYGLSSSHEDSGVAEVLSSWCVVSRRSRSATVLPPVDFMALNRDAVKSGLVTAKELSQYRAQRPPPRLQPITRKQQGHQPTTGLVPDIEFGLVKSRSKSPFERLLAHDYSQAWIKEQLRRDEREQRRLSDARVKLSKVGDTRTSRLRKTLIIPHNQSQTPPRTSHYSQVGPALDTFRDPESRSRAMKALKREAPSRRGEGRGVYNLD